MAEPGEEIVGTWLRYCRGCDFVDYNVQVKDEQGEIDVVGLNLADRQAFICEVASHIHGLNYKDNKNAVLSKFERSVPYAGKYLAGLKVYYMFWCPVVRSGNQENALLEVQAVLRTERKVELELVVNHEYVARLGELRGIAAELSRNPPHSVMRILQIEEWAKNYSATGK